MNSILRYTLVVFVVLLALSGLVAFVGSDSRDTQAVALSEVVGQINGGNVKEVTVQGEHLTVLLNDDKKLTSKKEPGISIFETLVNLGARPERVSQTKITIEEPSGASVFFLDILPVLLP